MSEDDAASDLKAAYSAEFYEAQVSGSHAAASIVLPLLFERWRPQSVVDVGCGVGTWCAAAMDLGVPDCVGIDGPHVPLADLRIPPHFFIRHDLVERLPVRRKADLAICLEVAEHLPADRAATLVADLCAVADIVLFSGALPYQGGTRHVNEHWAEYWATLFANNGFAPFDVLRDRIWHDRRIPPWYRQNVIVFAKPDAALQKLGLESASNPSALSKIHPEMYLRRVHQLPPKVEREFWHDDRHYAQTLAGSTEALGYGSEQ